MRYDNHDNRVPRGLPSGKAQFGEGLLIPPRVDHRSLVFPEACGRVQRLGQNGQPQR